MTEHDQYLKFLTLDGLDDRIGEGNITDVQRERVDTELGIIAEAQFASYFLIVWDLIKFCHEEKIPVGPGRGSVCGSFVCYLLGITDVDPLIWDIPFERFLHLERISMPDIDLDLCQVRRGDVVKYIQDKYGEESVAQIITYGTIQAKGAVRRAFKDLEVEKTISGRFSLELANKVSNLIPEGSGADQTILTDWLELEDDPAVEEFKIEIERIGKLYARAAKQPGIGSDFLMDTILYLEGRRAHGSVHSAGVVIGSGPLMELGIPLGRRNKLSGVHCEHDMKGAEDVGLLKLDVLGLRTMTMIGQIEAMIQKDDPDFNIKNVPLDDDETFELLRGGPAKLKGVFQLSKDSIGNALKGIHPTEFEDIIAILALYRPGPMIQLGSYAKRKLGEEKVDFAHPDLAPVLSRTYGLIVYQEQVMAIAQIMGGYTPGEGDVFRKAIGKKIPKLIAEELATFRLRAVERGYEDSIVEKLCTQIAAFGRYGFNRGHATGYGFITYWTAFLKCHYRVQFYTAVLNSHVGDADKIIQFSRDAATHRINLLTPNINNSGLWFQPEGDNSIRFGLEGVKGLGEAAATDIVEFRDSRTINVHTRETVEREKIVGDKVKIYKASIKKTERGANPDRRPYDDFADMCKRHSGITITAKKALIAAGAFDNGDLEERAWLYAAADEINKQSKKKRPKEVDEVEPEDIPDEMTLLGLERTALGSFITKHPLEPHRQVLKWWEIGDGGIFELLSVGRHIRLAGIVTGIRHHRDKSGNDMAWITLESDWSGAPEVMIFASIWKSVNVEDGDLVIVEAQKTTHAKFGVGLQAESVVTIDPNRIRAKEVLFKIPTPDLMDALQLKEIATKRGTKVTILTDAGGGRLAQIKTKSFIQVTTRTLTKLEDQGWEIILNPGTIGSFQGEQVERSKDTLQGRGAERRGIWELPNAKLFTDHLGGKVIAEYKPIE